MNDQRNLDIHFILGVFLKYCWLILLTSVLIGMVTFVFNRFFVRKIYRATAKVCIMPNSMVSNIDRESRLSQTSTNFGSGYQEMLVLNYLIYDINEWVASRNLNERMVERVRENKLIPDGDLERFGYRITPNLIRQTRMVNIESDSLNPLVAQETANTMAAVLCDYLRENYSMDRVSILDEAVVPKRPIRPRILLNTFIGLVLGGAGCFLLCFLKEMFRGTVDSPEIVTQRLHVPVLGTVMQLGEEISQSRQSTSRINNIVTVEVDGKTPRFDVAESFRLLRTNLQYSISKKNSAKIFVITSTSPKDGKTFIASNVATIIASSGQRVLLLNCDLRKPALHKIFNLERNSGIVNILVGEATFDDVINRNVLGLSLDVLASGPVPPNPSELLMSPAFQQLIDDYRDKYDYIILDAPPCLNISDAAIVGKLSDGIIYVVSAGQTRVDNAAHAVEQLQSLDIPVIGVILNRFSPRGWNAYGYGGYSYGYYNYYNYSYSYDYSEYSKPDVEENDKTV